MQTYLHATATLKPMRPSEALQNHITAIRSAIHQHHTTKPRVFGSVLAGTDRDGSDLNLLVDPLPETTLFVHDQQRVDPGGHKFAVCYVDDRSDEREDPGGAKAMAMTSSSGRAHRSCLQEEVLW